MDVAVGHALGGLEVGEQGEPGSGARDEVEHMTDVAVAHVLHHLSAEDQVGGTRQPRERDHAGLHETGHAVALDEDVLDHPVHDVQAEVRDRLPCVATSSERVRQAGWCGAAACAARAARACFCRSFARALLEKQPSPTGRSV